MNSKKITLGLVLLWISIGALFSQPQINATDGGTNCFDCIPSGWESTKGTPDISSSQQAAAQDAEYIWSWDSPLPLPPNNHTHWITLRDVGIDSYEENVKTLLTGLTPGYEYEIVVYSITDKAKDLAGNYTYAGDYIDYYDFAIVNATNKKRVYEINKNNEGLGWTTNRLRFVAPSEQVDFYIYSGFNVNFTSNSETYVGYEAVNLSITANAVNAVPKVADKSSNTQDVTVQVFENILSDAEDINALSGEGIQKTTVDLNPNTPEIEHTLVTAEGTWQYDVTTGNVTFTPNSSFTGPIASINYTVKDGYTLDGSPVPATSNVGTLKVTVGVDSDGDGIADDEDLDDDNDGILDTDELDCTNIPAGKPSINIANTQNVIDQTYAIDNNASTYAEFHTEDAVLILDLERIAPAGTIIKLLAYGGRDDAKVSSSLSPSNGFNTPTDVIFSSIAGSQDSREYTLLSDARYIKIKKFSSSSSLHLDLLDVTYESFIVCQDRDTDNDGIIDRLDTDSDGDGCFDALEAGGSVLSTQINANGQIKGGVDASGVPSIVNGGQATAQAVTDNTNTSACDNNPCDPDASGNLDSDGDGIADICDLDDDNDGILDTDEGFCDTPSRSIDWTVDNNEAKTTINGVGVTITSEQIENNTNTALEFAPNHNLNETNFWNNPDVAGKESLWVRFKWDTSPEHASQPIYGDGGTRTFKIDFDKPVRYARLNIDKLGGSYQPSYDYYTNTVVFTLQGSDLKLKRLSGNNQFLVNDKEIFREYNVNIGYPEPTSEANYSNGTAAGTVDILPLIKGDTFTSVTFVLSGKEYEGAGHDAIELALELCPDEDTDTDGIPDYLDLDSDNDGCPDAIEGGDAIVESDLQDAPGIVTGKNLGLDINSEGVPNIVNSGDKDTDGAIGQSVHYAIDENKNSCNNYWIGTESSTDWNTNSNWSQNEVPSPGKNIEFATADNNEGNAAVSDLYVPGDAINPTIIGNLTNESDKALVVPAEKAITINGTVTGSETEADAGKIRIKASANKPNGTLYAPGMCGSPLYGTVSLYSKGYQGSMEEWTDDIIGSPTYGLKFKSSYHWQYFGVPVKSVQANPTFAGSYLREYHEDSNGDNSQYYQKWTNLDNSSILESFVGYEITQVSPVTHEISGELQTCDKTLVMTRKAPAVGDGINYGLGQNIFGNSYTVAISVDGIVFPREVEQTVYLYNTGSFTDWGYGDTTGYQTNDGTQLIAGQYTSIPQNASPALYGGRIPSMNGFLLKFTDYDMIFGGSDVQLTLNYEQVATNNTKPQTAPAAPLSYLEIELSSRSTSDRLWLFSQPVSTTEGFDNGWDGRKFFGTPTAFIYSETPDGNMQVDASPSLDGKYITFYANADTEYTLYLNKHNLGDYPNLSLVDLATMEVIPLREGRTVYHFTSNSPNIGSKRFKLLGDGGGGTTGDTQLLIDGDITIEQFGSSKLSISNYTGQSGMMQVFDVTGRLVISRPMDIGINSYDISLPDGVYVVTATANAQNAREKIVIKK